MANRSTGEWGWGWRNHDELRVTSLAAGAEVGFVLDALRAETRDLIVATTRSPASGTIEIVLNGRVLGPALDLWAERSVPWRVRFDGVELRGGHNGLLFRVVGRNAAASGYEMGLDYIALE